ncbi:putative virion structural protein [Ralstonia phage RP31]|uniref:Putative virion structural protein n=1 Tax=Ralstonia phage RP31 TaxID=1923890 RepID=A0A1L7N1D3_9CAUD|nr:putative virion structural protein [Ralstonia phage RP31]
MTTTLNLTAVAGTDGKVPIYNPEGKSATYALDELWDGTVGEKRFVPNVGDLAYDRQGKTTSPWWIVKALDVDLIPTLEPWGNISTSTISSSDVLTGPGRLTHNSTYRAYLDKSVTPYVLAVENRLSFKGTVSRYARIFKQVTGPTDLKAVSAFYDNQGNLIGNDITLELVGVDANTNRSEYCVPVCYTMEDLPDGEVVTLIAYTSEGHPASITQLTVQNTSFIRHRNSNERYVTGIQLLSPFMSETDPKLINLPVNVPLQGLYLKARVNYSDGSSKEYPVDGTRFALLGMESYLASMVNQKIPVVLRYTPLPDDVVYGATRGEQVFVTQKYDIKTIEAKGAYNVRLYCFPEWVGPVNGYSLRWFLYSSERNARYDVTQFVQFSVNSPAFQPKLYGVNQMLNVSVNLKDINPLYEDFRHAQTVQVVLWRDGTERETNWSIVFEQGQDPAYGVNGTNGVLEFINYNYYKLKVDAGCKTVDEWLAKLYLPMRPIFDPLKEVVAPLPTHFRIRTTSEVQEHSVDQFNQIFQMLNGLSVNGNVYIEWIRKTPENDLELGTSGMILYDDGGVPLS